MLMTLRLLLPVLFPSWRFFKEVNGHVRVEARYSDSDWQEVCVRPARLAPLAMLVRLFWNPSWNAQLYLWSLAERLSEEENPDLAHNLQQVALRLCGAKLEDTAFCVVWVEPDGTRQQTEYIPPGWQRE